MSMLAEPRSRQKWSDDPRNTRWSSDKSKFGYQMLTKMGWSEGSGLGQNGTGCTSHVKVKKKRNNLGIGMKTSHDDDWIAHQDSFNALLTQLNQGQGADTGEKKIQSLEDRVRITKTKIMYSRFVKSKDLSRASSNDLACIFGQRSKSAPATPQRSEDEDDELSDGSTASCPTERKIPSKSEHGFTTINTGVSVADYFASKMAALKQKNEIETENIEDKENQTESKTDKKKNKKKKGVTFDDVIENDESSDNNTTDKKEKKKKKKRRKIDDENDEKISSEESIENDEEGRLTENTDVKKKKKKKKTENIEDDESVVICEKKTYARDRNEDLCEETTTITTPSKKKSKKRKHAEDAEDNIDNMSEEITESTHSKKSKKKKKKNEAEEDCDEEYSRSVKKKRKKKRKSDDSESDSN